MPTLITNVGFKTNKHTWTNQKGVKIKIPKPLKRF